MIPPGGSGSGGLGRRTLHASAVAVDGRGVLILGPAGAGKTTLALELVARGARLIADDRVELVREGDVVRLSPPRSIAGLVEVLGFGLLRMPASRGNTLALAVDLGLASGERMPEVPLRRAFLGVEVPLLPCRHRSATGATVMAVMRADAWLGGDYLPG